MHLPCSLRRRSALPLAVCVRADKPPSPARFAACLPPPPAAHVRAQVQIARVDATGVHIDEPITLKGEWNHAAFVEGSANSGDGGW